MELTINEKKIAMQARSAEELFELAKGYDRPISMEEAEKTYAELNKEGELADEELEDVAGGGCGPDYTATIYVHLCPSCGKVLRDIGDSFIHCGYLSNCDTLVCDSCNIEYWYLHKHSRLMIKPNDIA